MHCHSITFSGHAIRRMFERGLNRDDIVQAVQQGDVIKDYPDDTPYPSCLLLWFKGKMPVHVVVGQNPDDLSCYVVTAYVPSEELWQPGFRERKQP